jgi:hypothetical protein
MFYEASFSQEPDPEYRPDLSLKAYFEEKNLNQGEFNLVPLRKSREGNSDLFRSTPLSIIPYSSKIVRWIEEGTKRSAEEAIISEAASEGAIAVVECKCEENYFPKPFMEHLLGPNIYFYKIEGVGIVRKVTSAAT